MKFLFFFLILTTTKGQEPPLFIDGVAAIVSRLKRNKDFFESQVNEMSLKIKKMYSFEEMKKSLARAISHHSS